ncbi:MAG: hypothetical protein AUH30_07910 [Candidatus Rokubacteria bacterium 13_1_40CM_68_15]|nr:MAG: hypothetical protein AUH30_07910 [Candidatus Rokubacteria bacterium 13_1_40CM_68_15]
MSDRAWHHPWVRVERLIRELLERRWNDATWPKAKVALKAAWVRRATCAICGKRVDLREEHYRVTSPSRRGRASIHVECYGALKRELPP